MAAAHLKLLVYGEGRTSFDCCRYLPVPRIRAMCRRQFPNPEHLRFMLPAKSGEKEIMVDYDDLCWQCCWAAALRLSPVARLLGPPSRRNRHPSPGVVRSMEYKIRIAPFVPRRWVRDPDSGPSPRPPRLLHPRAQGHSTPLPRAALPAAARRQTAAGSGLCLGSGGASSMSSADRPPSQRLQLPFSSTATYQPDNNGVNFDIPSFLLPSGFPRHAAHHGCRKSFRSQGKHLLPFNPSSHSNPTSSIQGKVVLITGGK